VRKYPQERCRNSLAHMTLHGDVKFYSQFFYDVLVLRHKSTNKGKISYMSDQIIYKRQISQINIIIIRIWQDTSTQVKYVININN
jgi:hypothetical protein